MLASRCHVTGRSNDRKKIVVVPPPGPERRGIAIAIQLLPRIDDRMIRQTGRVDVVTTSAEIVMRIRRLVRPAPPAAAPVREDPPALTPAWELEGSNPSYTRDYREASKRGPGVDL